MSVFVNGEMDRNLQPIDIGSVVARYEHRPAYELGRLNEIDLREISSNVQVATNIDVVRPFFKKILIAIPSWYEASLFARSVPDLTYTPQEQIIIQTEDRRAEERKNLAERDIDSGVSPWLAHIRQNQQGIQNPYIVGFYRDDKGKIRKVYGERYFRSQRQIENSFFARRTETKEVNLLSTKFQRVEGSSIQKSEYWNLLPEDLRSRFEAGEILVTAGDDLYDLSESQIAQLAHTTNPRAVMEHVQALVRSAPDGYRLLYYSDYRSNATGRTGVLMEVVNGEVRPVTIIIDEKEYLVELKGCGTKEGGFGGMQHRTGRDIITGGAEKEQAINEFNRLSENIGSDKPKPVGIILFDNHGYDQGYIIRLTPSTVRASYSDNETYPEIDRSENVERVVKMYADELADQVYASHPKVLDRSSHTENLLIWGNGRFTFTDFSDHVVFDDKNYPHNEMRGGYMTPKQMLKHYINMVKEIPGYVAGRDQQFFYRSLSSAFFNKGRDLLLEHGDTSEVVTQKIWEQGGVAYQVFKTRKEGKYTPEGTLHEHDEGVNRRSYSSRKELALDSESAFIGKLQAGITGMRQALITLRSRMTIHEDRKVFERQLALVDQGDLISEYEVNGVYQRRVKVMGNNSKDKKMGDVFSYYGNLSNCLSPIRNYLEHEADLVKAAKVGCPDLERSKLQEAEQELKERLNQLVTTFRNPQALYKLLTDQEEARRMVDFSYYTT